MLAFLVLLGMMVYYGLFPTTVNVLWLPLFLLLALTTSLGVGLWLSALNVEYRDVRYIVPFITQFWMLATPIGYRQFVAATLAHTLRIESDGRRRCEGFRFGPCWGTNTALVRSSPFRPQPLS